MSDALNTLRKHADLTSEERAALDAQPNSGDTTRKQLASLLTAILCERVEGFHGTPGDWLAAGRALIEQAMTSAYTDRELISFTAREKGRKRMNQTFRPDELLLLWGAWNKAIKDRRTKRALEEYELRQVA